MNNKFKRFNKILMMTVAILLCFVLISTSVVSGIFAKYVITKSAGATVSLKKFGLTLSVSGTNTSGIATTTTPGANGLDVSVAINLAPGETATDALIIEIGTDSSNGKSSVATNLKITVDESHNGFNVPTSVSGADAEKDYIPIAITAKSLSGTTTKKSGPVLSDWNVVTTGSSLNNTIAAGMKTALAFTNTASTNVATYKICNANAAPGITKVCFTFSSPDDAIITGSDLATTDKIQTHLGTKTTLPQMVLTFTISLEQVVS